MSLYDNDINPVEKVELAGRLSSLSTTSTLHSYGSISSFSSLETLTRSYTHTSFESLSLLIPPCATYIASQTGHSGKSKYPIDIPPRRPVPIYSYQSRSKAHHYHPLAGINSKSAVRQDHELAINQYGTPQGYQEYHLPSTQEKPNVYPLDDRYPTPTRKPEVDPDDQIIQITEPVLDTLKPAHLRDSSTSHHGTKFEPQTPGMKRPSCPYFGSAASLYHNEYACCFSKDRAITLPIPTDGNCKEYALLPVPVTATLAGENRKSKTLILWPWVLKMEFKT